MADTVSLEATPCRPTAAGEPPGRAEPGPLSGGIGTGEAWHASRIPGDGMSERPVLVVDDEREMAEIIARDLAGRGYAVRVATSSTEAMQALDQEQFAVVLTDLVMPDGDGLEILRHARDACATTPVVLMTAFGSLETALAALRTGATDYVTKPCRLATIAEAVRRAAARPVRPPAATPPDAHEWTEDIPELLGASPPMRALKAQIRSVASSDATVLVVGESGTGKELVARAIHAHSGRRRHAFVAVNCAAIPEPLLESELFGHDKGAFTGAVNASEGLFGEADRGTIFLDEIADLPSSLQAKLLRVLQDRRVRPVGGQVERPVDLRIVSATNRDLPALVRQGRFRDDLYYRIAVIPIAVPSLRERLEDVPLLTRHFAERVAARLGKTVEGFSDEALACLQRQRWPGNVRQLQNVVERSLTVAEGPVVGVGDIRPLPSVVVSDDGVQPTLADVERSYIEHILQETRGDKVAAARILGISVRTIQRMFSDGSRATRREPDEDD